MVDLTADIIPYQAIAQIQLGANIEVYRDELLMMGCEHKENIFSNQSIEYFHLHGVLSVAFRDGVIIGITAETEYQGKYAGQVYAGMTLQQLKEISLDLVMANGALILNKNFGMVLWLASPNDELYDTVSELPDHAVIDSITVGNYDEWKFFC